jgi:chromate reductase
VELIGICGSLRRASINLALLRAAEALCRSSGASLTIVSLAELPLFNPDDEEPLPEPVQRLVDAVGRADGLLIATPEYAHTFSGVIKNALDWMVKNAEIWGKPVAVLSASTTANGGNRAVGALMHPLVAIKAEIVASAAISAATARLTDGEISDPEALRLIGSCVDALTVAAGRVDAAGAA